jgi:hypothetical protein
MNTETGEKYEVDDSLFSVKTTSRRWLSLFLYFGNAALCSFQWVNYVMIPAWDLNKHFFGKFNDRQ